MKGFFGVHGRMTRRTYAVFALICFSIAVLPIFIVLNLPRSITQNIGLNLTWITLIPILISHTILFFASIKRLHDMDMSGKSAFTVFGAPFGWLMVMWLTAAPYSDLGGVNQFGPNPRKSVDIREAVPPYPPAIW